VSCLLKKTSLTFDKVVRRLGYWSQYVNDGGSSDPPVESQPH
jgi:hypothetical protein